MAANRSVRLRPLIAVLALAALFPRPAGAQTAPRPESLVLPYRMEPTTFDPFVTDDASSTFFPFLFDGLYRSGENGDHIPGLALGAEVSRDGLEYRVTLRKGVLFQDGSRLAADDVAASFLALSDPAYSRRNRETLQILKSCRAEGSDTVVFSLSRPYGAVTSLLQFAVVPARLLKDMKAFQERCQRDPVGTGPFRIARRSAGEVVLEAFEGCYRGKPLLRTITLRLYSDQTAAWVAFLRGDVDSVASMEYSDYATIRRDARFRTFQGLEGFTYALLLNLKDPLFADRELRGALAAAVDRDDLVEVALAGTGVPASGPFAPGSWASDPLGTGQRYDPAQARKVLAGLGWKDADGDKILERAGAELAFTVLFDEGDASKDAVAKRLRWQFLQVGVRMDVEVVPVSQFVANRVIPGAFQAAFLPFNVNGDPGSVSSRFWHSLMIGKGNLGGYASAEADRLIDDSMRIADPAQRTEILRRLSNLVASDVPAVFLYQRIQYQAISSRFGGVQSILDLQLKHNVYRWTVKTGQ